MSSWEPGASRTPSRMVARAWGVGRTLDGLPASVPRQIDDAGRTLNDAILAAEVLGLDHRGLEALVAEIDLPGPHPPMWVDDDLRELVARLDGVRAALDGVARDEDLLPSPLLELDPAHGVRFTAGHLPLTALRARLAVLVPWLRTLLAHDLGAAHLLA